ncbi:DNA replication and repair protein RecF [Cellulophaga lytica]|uniref:DNA replication and repair protein RecF n=2 Tax=Cellulophaga TaxID=104264 RepID=F0RH58_CELLC|nr:MULTISPECIES: DNA replication and repair protein RecF [Cellulophaga]ADY28096.1 DNA replication and repair protein recF [Cellulophaga lytica DSM 7489]AIM59171.1 DNA recombination protein RecF [Cellulophaga lytica]EWH14252.1 DNA replication and repair protein RecF [Cellulophaga geojensis KL-A]WQG77717.1 DNA replication and repair protein RecF [Cellulophaga lytica]SNQ41897.1 DNA replication and repair protein RecF [Cellulophaga lytica]
MLLKKLSLVNYKNFDSKEFDFDAKINCFVGSNGVGKTNILDAIYHLSFGKSYFNPIASQNIKHGEDFFVVDGLFFKNDREEKIICSLKKGAKKVIKKNGKAYDKFSDHIGFLPLVIISPADRDLILEGSDTRRKFIDGVISQSNKEYLTALLKYNKILLQRNSLLKYFAVNHTFDKTTLSVYNEQLQEYGTIIHKERVAFLNEFIPIFKEQYAAISGGKEDVTITYNSKLLDKDLLQLFNESLEKDRAVQYTTVGTHKDDLSFEINNYPVKKFGSQGQQKSFLIALKLAQFNFIKAQAKTTPILLLDDIFDKLDENRVAQIVSLVDDDNFGQIFISDTHADRTENVVKNIHQSYKIFKI